MDSWQSRFRCTRVRSLTFLVVLAILTGCATPIVVKRETRDFVTSAERALDATRAFYNEVLAKDREATALLLSSDAGCRAESPILFRGPKSFAEVLGTQQFEGCAELPACDATRDCPSMCLSNAERRCWNALVTQAQEMADDVAFEFEVLPLPSSAFQVPLDLVEQSGIYLDVLAELAEEAQPRVEARLTDLLDRACALRDQIRTLDKQAGGAQAAEGAGAGAAANDPRTICPSETPNANDTVSDTTLGKELKAVGSLIDLIDVTLRNARDVNQLRVEIAKPVACTGGEDDKAGVEVPRGECFEQRMRAAADEVEATHASVLLPAEMSIVASLSGLYAEQAPKLTQPKRAELLNVWMDRFVAVERLRSQEPVPAKLLRGTAKAHAELRDMILNENYTDEQRREIAAENRRWLEDFFKRTYNAISVLGII